MSDDLTNKGPQDRSRISLLEPYEVQYWADKFGVSKERLSEAVRNVGHSAADVERGRYGSSATDRRAGRARAMSASPRKRTNTQTSRCVRFVPIATKCTAAKSPAIRRTGVREHPPEDALLWLDVGRPDHLGPLLGFFGNERPEIGR